MLLFQRGFFASLRFPTFSIFSVVSKRIRLLRAVHTRHENVADQHMALLYVFSQHTNAQNDQCDQHRSTIYRSQHVVCSQHITLSYILRF